MYVQGIEDKFAKDWRGSHRKQDNYAYCGHSALMRKKRGNGRILNLFQVFLEKGESV